MKITDYHYRFLIIFLAFLLGQRGLAVSFVAERMIGRTAENIYYQGGEVEIIRQDDIFTI